MAKSCLTLVTPWTVACQVPLCMGFPKQEYWSGLPFLSPGDLPNPGIEPTSPSLAGRFFTTEPLGKPKLKDITFRLIEKNGLKKEEKVPKQKRGQGKSKEREHCGTDRK